MMLNEPTFLEPECCHVSCRQHNVFGWWKPIGQTICCIQTCHWRRGLALCVWSFRCHNFSLVIFHSCLNPGGDQEKLLWSVGRKDEQKLSTVRVEIVVSVLRKSCQSLCTIIKFLGYITATCACVTPAFVFLNGLLRGSGSFGGTSQRP